MKPGLHQLAQSAATDGQVPGWDDASGLWVPGDVVRGLTSADASVTITDNGDGTLDLAASGGGGGGGGISPRVDDPADTWWTTTTGGNLGYDTEFDTDTSSLPSGWSWVNQQACSYTQYLGAGSVSGISTLGNVTALVRSIPTQTAWTATAKLRRTTRLGDLWAGLCVRTSSTGKLGGIASQGANAGVSGEVGGVWNYWNGPTSYGATLASGAASEIQYVRIIRTSTTWEGQVSADGISWLSIGTNNLSTNIGTPDQIGFYFGVGGGATGMKQAVSLHWFRVR